MDNYPNLTDHEKSADARELRRALDEARALNLELTETLTEKIEFALSLNDKWYIVAKKLLVVEAERDALRAQLPEGMEHCTIRFIECEKGHGRLAADNWIDHGCQKCHVDELVAERDALRAAVEAVEFITDDPALPGYCPWCKTRYIGHAADCQRQRALGLGE